MKCTIRTFAMIREKLGQKRVQIEVDDNIRAFDLLKVLTEQFPEIKEFIWEEDEISSNLTISVNGDHIPRDKLKQYQLNDADELVIIPPAGGG